MPGPPGVPDVVVVDHHDSYTWNLVHLVAGVTGVLPTVVQHDEVEPDDVLRHSHVVLSPGPGHPDDPADFAVGREVLLAGTRPVLGVCLGMQGLVTAYGGRVERVVPGHGVVATVRHDGAGLFAGLPQDFDAVRYHSLAAVELPSCLRVTATDERQRADHGRRARRPAAGGRAVPPGVGALGARRGAGRELPRRSLVSDDAAAHFREVAARHPRCFWLDGGGGARVVGPALDRRLAGGGRRVAELVGDLRRGHPARRRPGRGGRRRRLRRARGRAGRGRSGRLVVRLPGVRRAPRPARPPGPGPAGRRLDAALARSGCSSTRWSGRSGLAPSGQEPQPRAAEGRGLVPDPDPHDPAEQVPEEYAAAYARVQEHLHAGNSYEVNLTHRIDVAADLDPVAAYLRLRALNPAPYAGFLQHDVPGARAWLLSSSPERYATVGGRPHDRDPADQGHHPARPRPGARRRPAGAAGARAEVPRREPDDRRPAPQRPVDGLRAGHASRCRT